MYRRSYREPEAPHASLAAVPGGLAWASSYDAGLVAAFKQAVPPEGRRWDAANKRWIVDAQYGPHIARLCEAYLGVKLSVPVAAPVASIETQLIRLEYLGACKDRGSGEATAYGYCDGGWNAIFPESVLREWFQAIPQRPDEKPTLYAMLAVKPSAKTDEVRSAYRRLAKQWHPDTCGEPDAAEVFKAIQHAYQVLSTEVLRRKYDAGLALQASLKTGSQLDNYDRGTYRAPLRCGYVLCTGQESLGRLVVSQIQMWEDVVNPAGQTMVVSWPKGNTEFEVRWQ